MSLVTGRRVRAGVRAGFLIESLGMSLVQVHMNVDLRGGFLRLAFILFIELSAAGVGSD